MISALARASCSRIVGPKLSHEFHPMGGVGAKLRKSFAPGVSFSADLSNPGARAIPASTSRRETRDTIALFEAEHDDRLGGQGQRERVSLEHGSRQSRRVNRIRRLKCIASIHGRRGENVALHPAGLGTADGHG